MGLLQLFKKKEEVETSKDTTSQQLGALRTNELKALKKTIQDLDHQKKMLALKQELELKKEDVKLERDRVHQELYGDLLDDQEDDQEDDPEESEDKVADTMMMQLMNKILGVAPPPVSASKEVHEQTYQGDQDLSKVELFLAKVNNMDDSKFNRLLGLIK